MAFEQAQLMIVERRPRVQRDVSRVNVTVCCLLVWMLCLGAGFELAQAQSSAVDLIGTTAVWRLWKGTQDPQPGTTDWRAPDHDVSLWSSNTVPVGLDTYWVTRNPILRDMKGSFSTLFLRRTFTVPAPGVFDRVSLNGYVVGGCVIWVNGQEVVRARVPSDPLDLTDVALPPANLETGAYGAELPNGLVKQGLNVIAVRLLNTSLTNDQLFLSLQLTGFRDQESPVVERVVPEPDLLVNSLRKVELVFSESVAGVDASDLVANGVAATNVSEVATGDFVFDLPALPTGEVRVTLRPGHGITDTSRSSNALRTIPTWMFQLDPTARLEQLRITEFLADNERGLKDEDGSREDWFEVRNVGREAMSLSGWSVGTDPSGKGRWNFPDRLLSLGEYLVVFASGKNRTNPATSLHTGFKIPKSGGSLLLFRPDGTVAGGFTNYPAQLPDRSFGIVPGESGGAGFFVVPTPGRKNSEGGMGFAPEVEFSESSRTFTGTTRLTLATRDPLAEIRYTTNQTEPTRTSALYQLPLSLTRMTQIRARAYSPGLLPGPIRTEAFFPVSPNLGAYTSSLPVVLINDFDGGRPPLGTRIPAYIQVFEPGPNGFTRLLDAPVLTSRAGISTRGSSTAGNAKVNLRVEFRDEVDEDRKLAFGGLPADGDWILYGPSNFDPALINNPFAFQLSRDIGRYAPRTRFVEVYLVTRGSDPLDEPHYMGVYLIEERVELGNQRVDVERVRPGATQPPDVTGGYLFKIDRPGGDDGIIRTPRQQILVLEPQGSELMSSQHAWLEAHFNAFEEALYGTQFRDPVRGYRPFIDTPSWIDHHLLNVVLFNLDALRLSAYFHKSRRGPLAFGPVWDFDRSLRSTDGRDMNPEVWRVGGTDFFNYIWWGRLFSDPDFFQEYIDRYEELRRGAFSTAALHDLVDSIVSEVIEAQPREARRWGNRARGGYSSEIADLKAWLASRVGFIDGQFVRPPALRPDLSYRALRLDFTPTNGATTYFTLDGSDPRAPGGGLASGASIWPGTMIFATNSLLTLRTYFPEHPALTGSNSPPLRSPWSGIVRFPATVARPPIRLTEVHFNPAPAMSVAEEQDLEFIELHNFSSVEFDLSGFRLRGGILFDCPTGAVSRLPAGGRLIVAKDPTLLRARHPGLGPVTGPFQGRLSNDGDRIELEGRFGEAVQVLEFADEWVDEADGAGYSLVPVYEGAADGVLAAAAGWRRSAFQGGSPGLLDLASIPDMAPAVIPVAEGTRVRFTGALSRVYSVWVNEDPVFPAGWRKLGSVTAPASPEVIEWLDRESGGARFYRIMTP